MQATPEEDDYQMFEIDGEPAKPLAVVFTLRRTTVEYAHVKVFIRAKHMKEGRFDAEILAEDAVKLGLQADVEWKPDREPTIELHPMQWPPDSPIPAARPDETSDSV